MQVTFPILLAKKIFNTKKEFFLYEVNTSQEVIQYTFTNDVARYEKKILQSCLFGKRATSKNRCATVSRFF